MEIYDRLRLVREQTGESQAKFATRFEMVQNTYGQYENGKRSIPDEFKQLLSNKLNLNLNWLITGEGPMYLDSPYSQNSSNDSDSHLLAVAEQAVRYEARTYDDKETIKVPMTNLKFSAGSGVEWNSGEFTGEQVPVPASILKKYAKNTLWAAATVTGNSMEPTLRDGEIVIFGRQLIEGDGIYALSVMGELKIKRLAIDRLNGVVTVISDNTKYPPINYKLDQEGLSIIGKVLFWIHEE